MIVTALVILTILSLMFYSFKDHATSKTIVINCGHSIGYDSGATSDVIQEATLNQIVAGKLFRQLDARGYKVYITHTTDDALAPYKLLSNQDASYLRNVGPATNAVNPDLAISIHHNSGGSQSTGQELYWSSYRDYDQEGVYVVPDLWRPGQNGYRDTSPTPEAQESLRFAQIVRDNLAGFPNLPFRKIVERDDYLPAHVHCPCILYEGGYLSNPGEAAYMATEAYQDEAARRLADSIDAFFGQQSTSQISVAAPRRTVSIGGTMQLQPTFVPADKPVPISWSSDDSNIASVDENGVITGVSAGATTIRVTSTENERLSCEIPVTVQEPSSIDVYYSAHVQDIGWQGPYLNGETAGTTGLGKQVEALTIQITNPDGITFDPSELGINYRTLVQNIGWQDYTGNGAVSGTEGQGLQIEALQLSLTGTRAQEFDIFYRTHVEGIGWTGWASNGAPCGSEERSAQVEAVEVQILPKNNPAAPNITDVAFYSNAGVGEIRYSAHVQQIGWMDYVADGAEAGTVGQNLRLEALKLSPNPNLPIGNVECSAFVQDYGWRDYSSFVGTTGENRKMEALKIRLTGELGNRYDVHYQVYVQDNGWTDEVTNDQEAGILGQDLKIEAVKIWLTPK